MQKFRAMHGCRLLPLYGTLDLETNTSLPVCRREEMWRVMPTIREMAAAETAQEAACPAACEEDEIETELSFTLLSEANFKAAWRLWPVPENRTKFDATFMELYFTSLTAQVNTVQYSIDI